VKAIQSNSKAPDSSAGTANHSVVDSDSDGEGANLFSPEKRPLSASATLAGPGQRVEESLRTPSHARAPAPAIGEAVPLVRKTASEIAAEIARRLPLTISVAEAAQLARVSKKVARRCAAEIEGIGVKPFGRWRVNLRAFLALQRYGKARYLELLAEKRRVRCSDDDK
jgi:hypothetical protein